jgi:hypothetical protein
MTLETFAKAAGVVLAIIALGFTGYQIRETNKTLIFTTEQSLYKESRDILKFIADNPSLMQWAKMEDVSSLDEKDRVKLSAEIGILLSFYNSVLVEKNAAYISPEFRQALITDFCGLSKLPQVGKRLPAADRLGQPFEALANIKRRSCNG